jgi:hypothetical protein
MLFYQWKYMERKQLGEAFPHASFRPAGNGPIPNELWDDLRRLEKENIVSLGFKQWGKKKSEACLTIKLTEKGLKIASELWGQIPPELQKVTLKSKEELFTLEPEEVRDKVHKEYPEYAKEYEKPDRE